MCARSPAYYEIRVESLLDSHWEAWLGGLQVKSEGTQTIISGLLLINLRYTGCWPRSATSGCT